mmetsp:Transcript_4590/g.14826  ORF Transcript_4590/g.14826 Transcript_4590/m.14826 type:complete len:94 (+) Transcript_4590:13-294(+)
MSTKRADKAADERHQRAGRTPLLAVRGAAPAEQVDHPLELLARLHDQSTSSSANDSYPRRRPDAAPSPAQPRADGRQTSRSSPTTPRRGRPRT